MSLGWQESLDASLEAEASSLSLLQLLLQVEAHQVFARDDTHYPVGHVHHCQVSQPQRPKDDVRSMQGEVLFDVWRRFVDVVFLTKSKTEIYEDLSIVSERLVARSNPSRKPAAGKGCGSNEMNIPHLQILKGFTRETAVKDFTGH